MVRYLNSLSLTETSLVRKTTCTVSLRSSSCQITFPTIGPLNWETAVLNCKTEVREVFICWIIFSGCWEKGQYKKLCIIFFSCLFHWQAYREHFTCLTQQDACRPYDTVAFTFLYSLQVGILWNTLDPFSLWNSWCEYTQPTLYRYQNKPGLSNTIRFWLFTYITLP